MPTGLSLGAFAPLPWLSSRILDPPPQDRLRRDPCHDRVEEPQTARPTSLVSPVCGPGIEQNQVAKG